MASCHEIKVLRTSRRLSRCFSKTLHSTIQSWSAHLISIKDADEFVAWDLDATGIDLGAAVVDVP